MPLEIRPLVKEDAVEVAQLVVESCKNNRFRKIVFPNGMGQASVNKIADARIKGVDDPDCYALKVVNTENGEMAACSVWQYTKVMSDKDWEKERAEAMDGYPDARKDLLEEFVMKGQDAKQRVKKDQRWWG